MNRRLVEAPSTKRRDYTAATFEQIAEAVGLKSPRHAEFVYRDAIRKLRRRALEEALVGDLKGFMETDAPRTPRPTRTAGLFTEREPDPPLPFEERYPDWSRADTRVVSGPYDFGRFPGKWFPTRSAARRHWLERSPIYEEHQVPGRYIFRVKRNA